MSTQRPGGTRAAALPSTARGPFAVLRRVLPSGRSLAVAFAILAAGIGAYGAARGTSLFAVRTIEVEGASPRAAGRVDRALGPLAGKSLLSLDAADVDRRLAGLRDVTLLHVDRAFPSTLRVTVSAERPAAVLRRGPDSWVISERGRVLREASGTPPRTLARIWIGHVAVPGDGELLEQRESFLPAMALGRVLAADRKFYERVREARTAGDEVVLVLRSDIEVRLGSLDDVPLKIAVATRILQALPVDASGGYLDVSVPERAAAKIDSQLSS
ncbi:MAG TPA: FtsQ-type POTRA domain-containing protein [Gaiellaceae bacterium]|nr:FtsQ-type POTRA domain-containing protein [Gaiellaceae bacterium]